jgi:hypothetical protein
MTFHVMWMYGMSQSPPKGFEAGSRHIRELSKEEIFDLGHTPRSGMDETYAEAVERGDRCLVLTEAGLPVCLCWYARTGPVPLRRLWDVTFADDCVYVHGAFTHPLHRGKRLLESNLHAASNRFSDGGRRRMVALVESHNDASLRAFSRSGYCHEGTIRTIRIGAESFIRHSANCQALGVRIAPRPATGLRFPQEKKVVRVA